MRIIALDDEDLALENIMSIIRKCVPDACIKGFKYAEDAIDYIKDNPIDCAFLDVEMSGMNGVELARILTAGNSKVNIVFTTGYAEYRADAFDMHASGYILKPITEEKVRKELGNLRYPPESKKRISVSCFGNFEVYFDGIPARFKYSKTKELFAYIVDRKGALCSNGEIIAALFDNDDHSAYLRSLRKDLVDTFAEKGLSDVLIQQRGRIGIIPSKIQCDYYDWCNGKTEGNAYMGEYMTQYSWAESTNGMLYKDNGR